MARSLRIEYPGAFYHVTSRGNEQKDIFKSQRDREKFLLYLEASTERYGAVVHAYCLMSNHYHLVLETPRGNLSQIMRHINGGYTTYFNVKRKRAGHLFQGRYKAILVEADSYAKELSRYLHLNPVAAGMVPRPEAYRWSSYRSYIGQGAAPKWLTTGFILGYFGSKLPDARMSYRSFVEEALKEAVGNPLKDTVAGTVLGGADFVEEIAEKYLGSKPADRTVPALKVLQGRPTLDHILGVVKDVLGDEQALLKKAGIYACHRYSGAQLKEIGALYGVSDAAISQASRRFAAQLERDQGLKRVMAQVSKRLGFVKS